MKRVLQIMLLTVLVAVSGYSKSVSTHAKLGKTAPDFELKDLKGNALNLSDLKGQIVVLEWVNYDCPFVQKFYREGHMQSWQRHYAEQGVQWVQVSSAHKDHPTYLSEKKFLKRAKQTKAQITHCLIDASGEVGQTYRARTTPHLYLIDRDQTLVYQGAVDAKRSTDPSDIHSETNYLIEALDAMLKGEPVKKSSTKPYGCSVKY